MRIVAGSRLCSGGPFISSKLRLYIVFAVKNLKSRRFSRRWFLKFGTAGLAGMWAGRTDQMGARAVRGLLAESCRPVLKPKAVPHPETWDPNSITAAWLGHSTVLIGFYGLNILTDPALGRRVGADTFLGTIGPK